ncbi:MAG: GGDEF domain-containing protein, partial [Nitrosomonas sp.]|nr:GGDEF domain-containing protein [Nitrosomonas sp.]
MRSQILSATANLKLFFREYPIQTNRLIILVATLSILIIVLQLGLVVAAGVPYALFIFASLWVSGIQFTYFLAALGIIFTIIGFYLSPGIAVPINIAL